MILSNLFLAATAISIAAAIITGQGQALSKSMLDGAQSGVQLCLQMAGALCLWSGLGSVLEKSGITGAIAKCLSPMMKRLFPETIADRTLAGHLSSNICANLLGLGNAATPMGIRAVQRLAVHTTPGYASDSMCRFIVLNTASIQLIPATVAAVRATAGSNAPFDILPAVWLTSLCSATIGIGAAVILGKLWPHV